jgi:hypothetical protein
MSASIYPQPDGNEPEIKTGIHAVPNINDTSGIDPDVQTRLLAMQISQRLAYFAARDPKKWKQFTFEDLAMELGYSRENFDEYSKAGLAFHKLLQEAKVKVLKHKGEPVKNGTGAQLYVLR